MKEFSKIKIMLMTLGGSPEPLRKSIAWNQPEKVIFLASHDSISLSGEVLKDLEQKPSTEYEITENPNSLYECYKSAKCGVDRIKKSKTSPAEVLVDYTGGTKVMTAALILATAGMKFRFNYVGGEKRNKGGVGTVLNGHEKMFAEMSPWAVFAEEERRQVVALFNQHRYAAVIEIIDTLFERGLFVEQIRRYFLFVRAIAGGLLLWDQFQHKEALKVLNEGIQGLADYMAIYSEPKLELFSEHLLSLIKRLRLILSETKGLTQPHHVLIEDLLNNARRKLVDKRNDDAAVRIYRAIELYGQISFQQFTGSDNSSVDPDIIAEPLKEEFMKYRDADSGYLKLPLQATFRFLESRGDETGIRFFQSIKEIKNIQISRNQSILAHGFSPVGDHAAESIFQTVSKFVKFSDTYDFPRLPI